MDSYDVSKFPFLTKDKRVVITNMKGDVLSYG